MLRLDYSHRRARPHRPAAPGDHTSPQLSLDELAATALEPLAAIVGMGWRSPSAGSDDDPLDAVLNAASLAGQGGGRP